MLADGVAIDAVPGRRNAAIPSSRGRYGETTSLGQGKADMLAVIQALEARTDSTDGVSGSTAEAEISEPLGGGRAAEQIISRHHSGTTRHPTRPSSRPLIDNAFAAK